jgi:hypothetical protein
VWQNTCFGLVIGSFSNAYEAAAEPMDLPIAPGEVSSNFANRSEILLIRPVISGWVSAASMAAIGTRAPDIGEQYLAAWKLNFVKEL